MAWMGTFALFGVSSAMAFASFVLARLLAARAFRVGDRVAPFGEARSSGFQGARPGARFAIALAGPLGVYVFIAALGSLGFLLGGGREAGTTIIDLVPMSPAAAAGLQPGDRIVSVAGQPVARPADMRKALDWRYDGKIPVVFEREGRPLLVDVMPDAKRRLGVMLGPDAGAGAVSLGQAIRVGAVSPYEVWAGTFSVLSGRVQAELMGPVGITKETARRSRLLGERLMIAAMSQSVGVLWFLLVSFAMWPPRAKDRTSPAPADPEPRSEGETAAARPGSRLLARAVDWTLIALVPSALAPGLGAVMWLIWFPLEALFVSRWGHTPGKWLFGIAVRDAAGARLSFRAAFHRSAVLWTYGYGANTLFGFVTVVLAYASLKRNGVTYWDALDGNVISHRSMSAGRVIIAVGVLGLGLVLVALAANAAFVPR